MTATDPTTTALPATPGQALRWAADRLDPEPGFRDSPPANALRRWADELDAAPAVYALPPEPPDGTRVRDNGGGIWECDAAHVCPWWLAVTFRGEVRTPDEAARCRWFELLARGPLSTAPPAGTEGA